MMVKVIALLIFVNALSLLSNYVGFNFDYQWILMAIISLIIVVTFLLDKHVYSIRIGSNEVLVRYFTMMSGKQVLSYRLPAVRMSLTRKLVVRGKEGLVLQIQEGKSKTKVVSGWNCWTERDLEEIKVYFDKVSENNTSHLKNHQK